MYEHVRFLSVSQALRENTYPFLALVVLRDNKMTVVARIEGPIGMYGRCSTLKFSILNT